MGGIAGSDGLVVSLNTGIAVFDAGSGGETGIYIGSPGLETPERTGDGRD